MCHSASALFDGCPFTTGRRGAETRMPPDLHHVDKTCSLRGGGLSGRVLLPLGFKVDADGVSARVSAPSTFPSRSRGWCVRALHVPPSVSRLVSSCRAHKTRPLYIHGMRQERRNYEHSVALGEHVLPSCEKAPTPTYPYRAYALSADYQHLAAYEQPRQP
jgi:hypothetical protein